MKKFLAVLIAGMALFYGHPVFAESNAAFFSHLNDVPLMEGLFEVEEANLVFDKPGGRIIDAQAIGENVDVQAIKDFYNEVLPRFGWENTGESQFIKKDESLNLTVEGEADTSFVHISVAPMLGN